MSMAAVLLGIKDHLCASASSGGCGYAPGRQCDINDSGEPPPACGEFFVAIFPGSWSGEEVEGFKENLAAQICVTVRAPKKPLDRIGQLLVQNDRSFKGLLAYVEEIRAACHLDRNADQLMARINAHIAGNGVTVNGIVEPLRFLDGGRPERKGPDWFHSEDDTVRIAGVVQTLTVGSAARYETIPVS